jgi:hypothetical protein
MQASRAVPRAAAAKPSTAREASRRDSEGAASCGLHSDKCDGDRLECDRQPIFYAIRGRLELATRMGNHGGGTGSRRRLRPGHAHGRLALGGVRAVPLIVKRSDGCFPWPLTREWGRPCPFPYLFSALARAARAAASRRFHSLIRLLHGLVRPGISLGREDFRPHLPSWRRYELRHGLQEAAIYRPRSGTENAPKRAAATKT